MIAQLGGPGTNTVYGTTATLNAGDSLTGGSGNNISEFINSSVFNQLTSPDFSSLNSTMRVFE
jgi:hypothetical protein